LNDGANDGTRTHDDRNHNPIQGFMTLNLCGFLAIFSLLGPLHSTTEHNKALPIPTKSPHEGLFGFF
ncbi:MAG: hypothetical protein KBD23_05805, partial [Gammaproteobacteria bacterium]|nr:hypothetical protein [Gammaproteobacteria bacterium]